MPSSAAIEAMPGTVATIAALLGMLIYIGSVVATQLFGDTDPEHFGSLSRSLQSMFQVTSGDDWANVIRTTTDEHPGAYVFFLVYIVLSTYIVLNLFIAVAVEALETEQEEELGELKEEVEVAMDAQTEAILVSIADLKTQVSALEARLSP